MPVWRDEPDGSILSSAMLARIEQELVDRNIVFGFRRELFGGAPEPVAIGSVEQLHDLLDVARPGANLMLHSVRQIRDRVAVELDARTPGTGTTDPGPWVARLEAYFRGRRECELFGVARGTGDPPEPCRCELVYLDPTEREAWREEFAALASGAEEVWLFDTNLLWGEPGETARGIAQVEFLADGYSPDEQGRISTSGPY